MHVVIEVGPNITRTKDLYFLAGGAPGVRQDVDIDHDRFAGKPARFDGAFETGESRTGEMRVFDTDNDFRIPLNHCCGCDRIHVVEILLVCAVITHPTSENVEKREDSSLRFVNDGLFEVFEISPAGDS